LSSEESDELEAARNTCQSRGENEWVIELTDDFPEPVVPMTLVQLLSDAAETKIRGTHAITTSSRLLGRGESMDAVDSVSDSSKES
jgi:hypothetical protein